MTARFVCLFLLLTTSAAAQKPAFTVGWSIYAGWTPYHYLVKSGILKKWADKYGVIIKVQRFDYAPSLDAFVARNIDACAMTNMEVLVEKTVSEYLLDRAFTLNGQTGEIKQVRKINTSDSDIQSAFISDSSASAVVTWKPMLSQLLKQKGVTSLFNSSQIPGEILDLTVVRTDVLERADGSGQKFAKALAGAWYEMMGLMSPQGAAADRVLTAVAEGSADSLASYKEQLSTTRMFYEPKSAAEFGSSPVLKQKMALVRQFCFDHGLLGEKTGTADDVAIRYPDGSIQGKTDHVRLRFENLYMEMAAQGRL